MKEFVETRALVSESYFSSHQPIHLNLKKGRTSKPESHAARITVTSREIYDGRFAVPDNVRAETVNVSQLGLKELWVGGTAMKHNRWDHSCGVFNVGMIWLSALRQAGRVPHLRSCFPPPLRSWHQLTSVVGTALLLHDYGHLPFSHLLDEVLKWMHWVPNEYDVWGSEAAVLESRFGKIASCWEAMADDHKSSRLSPSDFQHIVRLLILGGHGTPWIQALVNSPVDADKIDYIRFDSAFLKECDFGISQRLHLDEPSQWLTDFLQEQEVNHAGNLCLHGRSAIAAADLWRERMSMYDRFYLSPELRVPERMAFEIIQQFLIRTTMSSSFAKRVLQPPNTAYLDAEESGRSLGDSILPKYKAVCEVMQGLVHEPRTPQLEFTTLERMHNALRGCSGIDRGYRDFLDSCFANLAALARQEKGRKKLREIVETCLVEEPIVFARDDFQRAQEIIRPLQHTYGREALIDLIRMPRVLAGRRSIHHDSGKNSETFECPIIVPAGPVEKWGSGRRASMPLTDSCVEDIELPICRITVISPDVNTSHRARYVWERVRSALLDGGVSLQGNEQ